MNAMSDLDNQPPLNFIVPSYLDKTRSMFITKIGKIKKNIVTDNH
jgi:hypothetical protein